MTIDATHAASRKSWVASANDHPDFPIQNLPLGWFGTHAGRARAGVAIGDAVFDLAAAADADLLSASLAQAVVGCTMGVNPLLQAEVRQALRREVGVLLDADAKPRPDLLHAQSDCVLHLPATIGDYTDFYAGIAHAINVGRLMRPDNPLLPNYKYVPIGYHGRASSVRASGAQVRRPNGQRKPANETVPSFGPCRSLDYELELGIWIGSGNALGTPIPIGAAWDHIAGVCLLNDWSARDIQGWEYQPLGPFLAKSFITTVSPWIVTAEALAPFRIAQGARPAEDPAPLDYLFDQTDQRTGALDIDLAVTLQSAEMAAQGMPPMSLTQSNARHLYWTAAQFVAHHTCGGCDLRPGDLFGSGTISGPAPDSRGSLLEITEGGRQKLTLPSGETRAFLDDGDTVRIDGHCRRDGFATIGFGACEGRVTAAPI